MRAASLVVLTATPLFATGAAAESWEEPKTFEASQVLTPQQKKGEHHEVDEKVTVESYYYAFELHTDFGELKTVGLDLLRKRIHETAALEALNGLSKTGVFLDGAGRSLESMGEGIVHLVKDPEGTVYGLGPGLRRFGINLGRKTKRTVDDITEEEGDEHEKSMVEETEGVANAVFGVNKAARIWAKKLGVDPYSRNPVLEKALMEVAQVDTAGSIATKVVVPIPMVVSATSKVVGLVWSEDPEALLKTNEAGLKALGVSKEVAARFFRNRSFTLTDQTRFVKALAAVKAKGLADYVDAARRADNPREALFFVESAEMLERQHGQAAVDAVLTDSRAMVALSGGQGVALFPLDYLAWTEHVAEVTTEIAERAGKELGASGLQMQLTGQVSERARKELQTLGWALKEHVSGGAPLGQ